MGWLRDDAPEHEGYLIGVVRDGYGWRELHYGDERTDLTHVQVGCDCGWRSPRLVAPIGTDWAPCAVFLPSRHSDEWWGAEWWDRHIGTDVLARMS